VEEFLEHPIYFGSEELNERTSVPGIVPGLAYTPFGGDILFIEATRMPGGRGFQVTGSIGNVMQESARAALSYVRSRAEAMHPGLISLKRMISICTSLPEPRRRMDLRRA
jgi:ATP-dependent Lon protease